MLTNTDYIFGLILSFVVATCLTPLLILVAKRFQVVDRPDGTKKLHQRAIPLMGGVAVFLSFSFVVALYYFASTTLNSASFPSKHLLGLFIGGLILMIGGVIDDKYNLRPKYQLIAPFLAILTVIISGIGIDWFSNPFSSSGGIIYLNELKFNVLWWDGLPYKITLLSDLFTLAWLFGLMYTTKLLDGLDGLVSGVAVIGSLLIFITSLIVGEPQSQMALLSIVLAGSFAGFLIFNFNPAKIFLGEGGSLFAGFMLGTLSIMSGSKVAVTLMVLALPALDVIRTIARRLLARKNPFTTADRGHLHHRLLSVGFSVRSAVLIFYCITIILGVFALILQQAAYGLFLISLAMVAVFCGLLAFIYWKEKEEKNA